MTFYGLSRSPSRSPAYTPSRSPEASAIPAATDLGPLPVNSPLIATGNSWTAGSNAYNSAVDRRSILWGMITGPMEYLGNKWRITNLGNKAVSGAQSSSGANNIAGQLSGALATVPADTDFIWWCPERFLNDVAQSTTAATGSSDYDTDIAAVVAAGGRCVIGTCPPQKPSASSPWTSPQQTKVTDFNALVCAKSSTNVKVIDYDEVGLVDADYSNDIHLTKNGYDKVAAWIKSSGLLDDWLPSGTVVGNLGTEYTDNPGLTGGSSSGPSGWSISVGSTGATATWNTSTKQLTISRASGGSAGDKIEFSNNVTSAPVPVSGDVIESIVDYDIVNQTGLLAINNGLTVYDASFANKGFSTASTNAPAVAQTDVEMARDAANYVNRGPVVTVASGTPNRRYTNLQIFLIPGTVDIVLTLNRVTSQKVA